MIISSWKAITGSGIPFSHPPGFFYMRRGESKKSRVKEKDTEEDWK